MAQLEPTAPILMDPPCATTAASLQSNAPIRKDPPCASSSIMTQSSNGAQPIIVQIRSDPPCTRKAVQSSIDVKDKNHVHHRDQTICINVHTRHEKHKKDTAHFNLVASKDKFDSILNKTFPCGTFLYLTNHLGLLQLASPVLPSGSVKRNRLPQV
jgi:hypothetical protein